MAWNNYQWSKLMTQSERKKEGGGQISPEYRFKRIFKVIITLSLVSALMIPLGFSIGESSLIDKPNTIEISLPSSSRKEVPRNCYDFIDDIIYYIVLLLALFYRKISVAVAFMNNHFKSSMIDSFNIKKFKFKG